MQVCTVFAQLTVGSKWQGPHVFVVRIRDDEGRLERGVRIEDNGAKMGLNGVDNGRIWLSNVRVPRGALLDRYATVSADGQYKSSIPSVSSRFGERLSLILCLGRWSM
jgi:acyl-CoA oxidase